jgi:hypothetical protein
MKVSINELKQVIDAIVAEKVQKEVKRILPEVLARVLSEQFLKKVMLEMASSQSPPRARTPAPSNRRPTNLRELMQGDAEVEDAWEEETPRALENDHQGIYHQSPLVRGKGGQTNEARKRALAMVYGEEPETALEDPRFKQREEAVNRLTQGNPDMAMMFEGTKPAIPDAPGTSAMGETQQMYGEEGVPLDFLGKIGVNFAKVKQNVDGPVPEAAKERVDEDYLKALERRRAQLNTRPA